MLSRLSSHVRHNVVGYIALFFALTGVAYAAGPLKSGDPAGGDLTGTYPNPSIAANAVNSGKVSNDSLTGTDILESSLGQVPNSAAIGTFDVVPVRRSGTAGEGLTQVIAQCPSDRIALHVETSGDPDLTFTPAFDRSFVDVSVFNSSTVFETFQIDLFCFGA